MITTKLTDIEFFSSCINTDIPELSSIPFLIEKGDIAGSTRVFAGYIRNFLKDESKLEKKRLALIPSLDRLKKEAERVKGHTLISCRVPYTFGEVIDWEINPTYNNYKEWPWVLNRHFDWSYLANYYLVSGDESFASEWASQFLSWAIQAQCPDEVLDYPGGSIRETKCWRTLEAAIRMNCWPHYIEIFSQASSVSDEVLTVFFKSVCEHGRHLSKSVSERNFLIQEMSSLAEVGFRYPFLKESSDWLSYANRRLEEQVSVQVYPDGMHYEMTMAYHNDCLHRYYDIYNMYVSEGVKPPEYTLRALELMYGVYAKTCRPDFYSPTMNDGAGIWADNELRTASKIFPEREDFRYIASHRSDGKVPDFNSTFLDYSGIVIMRSGWDADAIWAYMDGSPLGYGHHHDDRNNIQMYAYGHELLPEAGTFDYDTSEMRRYVTSSRGHNCSRMDGRDQNMRKSYKRVPGVTSVKSDTKWLTTEYRDVAVSDYTSGYGNGDESLLFVDWTRKLIFMKNEIELHPFFIVVDRFKAKDDEVHNYELIWHLHDNPTTIFENTVVNEFSDGVGVKVSSSNGQISVVRGLKSPVFQGWLPKFGIGDVEHYPIPTILNHNSFSGSVRVVTVIEPYNNGRCFIDSVEASSDFGDCEFSVKLKDGKMLSFKE